MSSTASQSERRADPRLAVVAAVRLLPSEGGVGVTGELVDVSAGGVRVRYAAHPGLVTGDRVEVEIRVKEGGRRDLPRAMELRGAATVTRVSRDGERGTTAAVCFRGPLDMPEPFAQLLVF